MNPIRVPRPLPQKPSEQRGEVESSKPTPAEQQAAERLGKPPPQEAARKIDSPVHEQNEPQAGKQEEAEDFDFPVIVFPSATWPGPFDRRRVMEPSEQRGEAEPFQPNPAEQQAKERLGKPPPKRRGRPEKPLERTDTRELTLGSLIRKYRAEKGMSMRELAAQVGYHPHSLSGIETNAKNPSSVKLWNIAKSLEVSFEELLQAPVHPRVPVPFWKSPRFGGIGRAPMRPAVFRGHERIGRRPSDENTQPKP